MLERQPYLQQDAALIAPRVRPRKPRNPAPPLTPSCRSPRPYPTPACTPPRKPSSGPSTIALTRGPAWEVRTGGRSQILHPAPCGREQRCPSVPFVATGTSRRDPPVDEGHRQRRRMPIGLVPLNHW
jgi:hypothetical protein